MADDPTYVLSIGSVIGGVTPQTRVWRDAIRRFAQRVATARAGVTADLNVNVVFDVPGEVAQAGYEGVRTGSYSKAQRLLMVQVALPEAPPSDAAAHLRVSAIRAVEEAERWASAQQISDDLTPLRDLLLRA
jgi:hypothetical protein